MAYTVISTPPVKVFLRDLKGLSRERRVKLISNLLEPLREDGDCFRRHCERADADHFWYSLILNDKPPRAYRFLVRDAVAPYGVLEIVFSEELTQ